MCGGKSLRTRHRPPGGAPIYGLPPASHGVPTPRTRLPWPRPSRPAAPARTWGVEARANGFYSHLLAPYLRPTYTPRLANRGRRSRPPAPAPARARCAPHLPSARCYPGPAGASAGGDLSARRLIIVAAPAPSGWRSCPESPFARGAAQADRHWHLLHRSAII